MHTGSDTSAVNRKKSEDSDLKNDIQIAWRSFMVYFVLFVIFIGTFFMAPQLFPTKLTVFLMALFLGMLFVMLGVLGLTRHIAFSICQGFYRNESRIRGVLTLVAGVLLFLYVAWIAFQV